MSLTRYAVLILAASITLSAAKRFTLEQVMSGAFPTDLTAASQNGKVAWVLDEHGARNLWVAEAPDYQGRRLTNFTDDDGQEIAQIAWTPDAKSIVYVRGGDFETRRTNPNPASLPQGVDQSLWIVPVTGGAARKLGEGNSPALSPKGDRVVYLKNNEVWSISLEEGAKPAQLIHAKGQADGLRWSPDGSRIAFVSGRVDHSFIGVYDFAAKSLRYLDASTDRDSQPAWSADSKRIAFVRVPVVTRAFMFGPVRSSEPWSIRVADVETGESRALWKAEPGAGSAFHAVVSDNQLFWGAGDRFVFPWERTGFVHLYSVSIRGDAARPLNHDGEFEVEHVSLSKDAKSVLFSSNEGDIDRRHLWRVSVLGEDQQPVTKGDGLEWSPVDLGGGQVAVLHSDATHPARAAVVTSARIQDLAPPRTSQPSH